MNWRFLWNGKEHTLEWLPDRFKTDFKPLEEMVMRFINWKREVKCGYLGPYLIAGLDTDVRAWGTMSEAFGELEWQNPDATLEFIEVPWVPVEPEPLNDQPEAFVDRVAKRLPH